MITDTLIGPRGRDIRRRLGLTLDDVAERANISKGHLSRFERGEKALSVAAMLRLASALETTVGTLVGEELDASEVRLVRNGTAPIQATEQPSGLQYRTLSGAQHDGQNHTTVVMDVPAQGPFTADAFHAGKELLYVLDGEVEFEIGSKKYALHTGDYLEFPGHVPHAFKSNGRNSRVLLVIVDAAR